MSTNKNPFEIRAEMLKLAKDYMDQQYHMNVQYYENMIADRRAVRVDIQESLEEAYKMYSIEDLMQKAQEMYSFVSKKD